MSTETGVTPIRWDLTGEDAITQGADWSRYVALYYIDPDTGLETIWNTTGFTGRMAVRADYTSTVSLSCTTENGRLVTGIQGTANASTTLATAAASGATVLAVASATGIVVGQTITVALDTGGPHVSDVTAVSGTNVTIRDAMPGAAAIGKEVRAYTDPFCLLITVTAAATAALVDWGIGLWDLELVDQYGHVTRVYEGRAALSREVSR